MKIPGSDDTTRGIKDGIGLGSHARGVRETKTQGSASEGSAAETASQAMDTVTMSPLALLMGEELDPAKMAEERKRRVEELKQRISKGEYNPNITQVAGAVGEEISLEILLAGSK